MSAPLRHTVLRSASKEVVIGAAVGTGLTLIILAAFKVAA